MAAAAPFLSPTFDSRRYGVKADGSSDDLAAIHRARDAAYAAGGGVVSLPPGTITVSAAVDTTATPGVYLRGAGRGATTITANGSYVGSLFYIGDSSGLEQCSITVPASATGNGVKVTTNLSANDSTSNGVVLRDLYVSGGASSSVYAISVLNTFRGLFENISVVVSCNGWEIGNTHNDYNYGNSTWIACEVSLQSAGKIGWDIHGVAGTKNVNLCQFLYLSAVTGSGTGSTGIKIRNCSYLTFVQADIEGVDTALSIQGAVSGGALAQSNVFVNPFFGSGGAVTIDSSSPATTFVGGRFYGTVTDSATTAGKQTRYLGSVDSSGVSLPDLVQIVKTGPRFGPEGLTCRLRNQTGTTLAQGTVVREAGVDFGVQKSSTATSGGQWVGVTTASSAAAADVDVGVTGVFYVLSTSSVTRGDYMILDSSTDGSAKSNGTTAPTTASHFVGIAMESVGSPGLVATRIAGFRP